MENIPTQTIQPLLPRPGPLVPGAKVDTGRGSPLAPQNEIPHSATLGSAEVKVLVPKERRCSQGKTIKPKRIFSRSLRAPYNTRCISQNLRAQRWLTVQSRLSIEHPLDSFLFCSHQSRCSPPLLTRNHDDTIS